MADTKIDIDVRLNNLDAKMSELENKSTISGKNAGQNAGKSFAKGFGSAMSSFKGFVGAIAFTEAIGALSRGINSAITDLRDFSKATAEVNSILPKTERLTDDTTKAFQELSKTFGTTASRQAKSYYNIVSAGIKGVNERMDVLNAANKASVAGLTEIDDATRVIVSSMNAYAASGLTANQASDALFVAVREGLTTFGELSASMGNVAPIASQVGVSFQELSGAVAFITKSGVKTDTAIIQLRQTFASILKPSAEAATEAKKLGLEFNAAALRTKGFVNFMADLRKKTGGSSESLTKLFGNIRALSGVMNIVKGDFADFNRITGETKDSVGATGEAFKIIKENVDFKIKKLVSELRDLGLTLANEVLPSVINFISTFKSGLTGIKGLWNDAFGTDPQSQVKQLKTAINGINSEIDTLVTERTRLMEGNTSFLENLFGVENAKKTISFKLQGLRDELHNNQAKLDMLTQEKVSKEVDDNAAELQRQAELLRAKSELQQQYLEEINVLTTQWKELQVGANSSVYEATSFLTNQLNEKLSALNQYRTNDLISEVKYQKAKDKIVKGYEVKRTNLIEKNLATMTKNVSGMLQKGLVSVFQSSFQEIGMSLAGAGQGFKSFGASILGILGDTAIQIGAYVIATSDAIQALKLSVFGTGFAAIAAGAALITIGGMLKGVSSNMGGSESSTSSLISAGTVASDGGGVASVETPITEFPAEEEEQVSRQTETKGITINIQGDVLDSEETGLRLTRILNDNFDLNGTVVRNYA